MPPLLEASGLRLHLEYGKVMPPPRASVPRTRGVQEFEPYPRKLFCFRA